ncbi:MAG: T9SS type A sorting domain-containing protein [Sediminibacterium sp.]
MRINKGTYLVIIMLLACTTGMAQMSTPFIMTPIAITSGSTSLVGGSPITMEGGSKCLTVSTGGIRSLETRLNGTGKFGASCEEVAPVATPLITLTSINLYPNPTRTTTMLKCEGQFDANLSCQIRVISMDGKVMMSQMVPMKDLQAGLMINASSYAVGTYAVTIDFKNEHYSKKLIKL